MFYYLILASDSTQYVATTHPMKGDNITPLTAEQYKIIIDIYEMDQEDEEYGLPPIGDV